MNHAANWGRIPNELRERPQWVIASADSILPQFPDKAPLAVAADGSFYKASVTDPSQWMDFNTAAQHAYPLGLHVGYVLHSTDPFTCIDFDVKDATNCDNPSKFTTPDDFARMCNIAQYFDSYGEMSRSGKGWHIWVRGKVGKGLRRDGIELYSQERYIICTGNVFNEYPVKPNPLLEVLAADMARGRDSARAIQLVEVAQEFDDKEIVDKLMNSHVSQKFWDLWTGNWQKYEYPSQSEADLSLMSYFTYYSASNMQCRRLFRASELGKRDKATKNDRYLNYTLSLVRARQANEDADKAHGKSIADNLLATMPLKGVPSQPPSNPLYVPGLPTLPATPPPAAVQLAISAPTPQHVVEAGKDGLPWPPGFVGEVAKYIYQSAPRPVKEVAIVGALGLAAGILGKAYSIPQSGLNMYIILVARSAIGKEAMHTGVSTLVNLAAHQEPAIHRFVNFNDFASGPALTKACAQASSFVNVCGEWGHKLKRLANPEDQPMASLRQVMTNLYQKSGPRSMVGGITYSNQEGNIEAMQSVAYSMIGETTPSTFFDALTEEMMADGFLSRFNIIHYDGGRPKANQNRIYDPNPAIVKHLAELSRHAHSLNGRNVDTPVQRSDEAAQMFQAFEDECDAMIESHPNDEARRQMWNRASLKTMRMSALLAAANNPGHPRIEKEDVEWCLRVVRSDIALMTQKLDSGDVGTDDHSRDRKIMSILAELVDPNKTPPPSYGLRDDMRFQNYVPRAVMQMRTSRLSAFMKYRHGATMALDHTMRSLEQSGYIMVAPKKEVQDKFNFQGVCYRVLRFMQ